MGDSPVWSVDQLAATNLLAALKLDPCQETLDLVAEHLARHRQSSHTWAAERVHSNMMHRLEIAALACFERRNGDWTDGFRAAEEEVSTMRSDELLQTHMGDVPTKGGVLRSLLRQARRSSLS